MLTGITGDISWTLGSTVDYIAGTQLGFTAYVYNNDAAQREYMLFCTLINAEGTILADFCIPVDDRSSFIVEPADLIKIPCSVILDSSNATLTLKLYDRVSKEYVDTVYTNLVIPSGAVTGILTPGATITQSTLMFDTIIYVMFMVMMMKMMNKSIGSIGST